MYGPPINPPSSRNAHAWYGQVMRAVVPHPSSNCAPRWMHTLSNAATSPSSPRSTMTDRCPAVSPPSGTSAVR
jgi:hypothetical protein